MQIYVSIRLSEFLDDFHLCTIKLTEFKNVKKFSGNTFFLVTG